MLPGLSLLLLAAHWLHGGSAAAAAAMLLLIGLLAVRKPWASRTLQLVLAAGALEWLRTLASLVQQRQAQGEPYLRLAVILGAVALVTALSILPLRRGRAG
ncbi:MAG: hypothetical protein HY926_09755 [Elusimicrobia bacterium]|nr:hypothetical protein [Elusimicrobiota bacterium]